MKKLPCKECPFTKKSLGGFLADYDPQDLHMHVMHEQHFPCHMTLPNVKSIPLEFAKKFPQCTGSIMYMKKGCKRHSNSVIQKQMDSYSQEEMENILSIPEFFKHHKR